MRTTWYNISLITLLFGLLFITNSTAQEDDIKNYRMMFKFNTVKQSDNTRLLEVNFTARHKKDRKNRLPFFEAEIKFFNVLNDEEILLGTSLTDEKGFARLTLPENQSYLIDEEGYINFKALFEETDKIDSEEDELAIKDIFIDLELSEIDSVKTAILNAYTLDSLQSKTPVEELDVVISVGGFLSKMPIEEATIEDGIYEFEFPTSLPGDVNGDLDVFVTVEDHDDFGNLFQKKSVNWGTFNKEAKMRTNTLWSEAAPIWMYVVLTILLLGVWANYIYTIVNLLRIKREGRRSEYEEIYD